MGLLELSSRIREALLMSGALAISILALLVVNAFAGALAERYDVADRGLLVAMADGTAGELLGSRLPVEIGQRLLAGGASFAVPEVRTIVGTSAEDARIVRGIPLESYQRVESFRLVAGRALAPGDSWREAMIGVGLAEAKSLTVGSTVSLRGRQFRVAGVFAVDTYSDFEVWIALPAAQELLGWGSDVSIYLLPAGETWRAGDALSGGIVISPNGQTAQLIADEWEPLLDLMRWIVTLLGLSTTVALSSMIWRLARLRRRQLAVLRALGYVWTALTAYLLAQTFAVTCLAFALGVAGAIAFAELVSIQGIGLAIEPVVRVDVVGLGLLTAVAISVVATVMPAWALAREDLQVQLR